MTPHTQTNHTPLGAYCHLMQYQCAIFFFSFLCLCSPLYAETLIVEIANPSNDLLSNVSVSLTGNLVSQQTRTDSLGRGRFYNLDPGAYHITYQYKKQTTTLSHIIVAPQATTELILTTPADNHPAKINYLRTGTAHDINQTHLTQSPILDAFAWAQVQPGVAFFQNKTYIRGGRADETRMTLDGLPEPRTYWGTPITHIPNSNFAHVTIAKGGFNAKYGHAMAGMVNLVSRLPNQPVFGNLEGITDRPNGFGHNRTSTSLGTTLFKNRASGIFTAHWYNATDADPRRNVGVYDADVTQLNENDHTQLARGILPYNGQQRRTLQGQISTKLAQHITLKTRLSDQKNTRQYYEHSYRYNLRHAPKIQQRARDFNAQLLWQSKYIHIVNRLAYSTYQYHQGDGVHLNNLFAYGRPTGNPRSDIYQLFWQGDQIETPIETTPDGFFVQDEGHVYNEFLQQEIKTFTPIDLHVTTHPTPYHTLQAGFQINRHTVRSFQHLSPTQISRPDQGQNNIVKYGYGLDVPNRHLVATSDAPHPIDAAAYLQSKIEYRGFIFDFGMRFDYFKSNAQKPASERIPLGGDHRLDSDELIDTSSYLTLSPRMGVRANITSHTAFHAHYGAFRQPPNFGFLYFDQSYFESRVAQFKSTYAFGNPNLQMPRTNAFEMGLYHQLASHTDLDATVYFKRTTRLPQRTTILAEPAHYDTYHSTDVASLRGIEITTHIHPDAYLDFRFGYTYAHHFGTGISNLPEIDFTPGFPTYLGNPSSQSIALAYERRHSLTGQVHLLFPASIKITAFMQASTGRAYTPTDPVSVQIGFLNTIPNGGALHSARTSGHFQLDLRAGKTFNLKSIQTQIFVSVFNLSNHDNPSNIYTATGQPQASGWLATEEGREYITTFGQSGQDLYEIKERDPIHNGRPRQVFFGIQMQF